MPPVQPRGEGELGRSGSCRHSEAAATAIGPEGNINVLPAELGHRSRDTGAATPELPAWLWERPNPGAPLGTAEPPGSVNALPSPLQPPWDG